MPSSNAPYVALEMRELVIAYSGGPGLVHDIETGYPDQYIYTGDIRKVTFCELLTKHVKIKNYWIQKIRTYLSYFST
jgi:hypothetical protein